MASFKNFYNNSLDLLQEKLITFGGQANPKNGNVVILAGGSGSGKGFTIKNLLGIQGKILDPDRLKELALKSPLMLAKYPELKTMDLRKPDDVSRIHDIVNKKEKLNKKVMTALKKSVLTSTTELPNLIFDTTFHELEKLKEISDTVLELGYQKSNIHVVWVLTDIKVAIEQNAKRSRVVPHDILLQAHTGAAFTMSHLIKNSDYLRNYMDGDMWVSFNVDLVDVEFEDAKNKQNTDGFSKFIKGEKPNKGNFVKNANYIKIKSKGKAVESEKIFRDGILQKVKSYVPDGKF